MIGQPLDQPPSLRCWEERRSQWSGFQEEPRAGNRSNAVWRLYPAMLSMCSFMTEPLSGRVRAVQPLRSGCAGRGAVIAATPVTDTIKRVDAQGVIVDTPDRAELWAAQTPQAFAVASLARDTTKPRPVDGAHSDDDSLFERLGWDVRVLDAGPANIKVTTPFDLTVARPSSVAVERASPLRVPRSASSSACTPLAGLHCHRFRGRPADRRSPGSSDLQSAPQHLVQRGGVAACGEVLGGVLLRSPRCRHHSR